MKRTRLCDLLGIEYPIIQAPMAWIATAELAAAVSNAGGMGTIGPNAGMTQQSEANDIQASILRFREQVRKAKSLTDKPFAANITVGWGKQRAITDRLVDIAVEEKLAIAVVSMGSSKAYTGKLKGAGIKVIHAVGCVEHAIKAQEDGVDAVVCEGYEAGGHLGGEELTTFVMVPQIADAVSIPLIAGGGIVDARGVLAAFALGADGVYMGTRFMATVECAAHPRVKQAAVDAIDTSTVAFARKTGLSRCLKNEYVRKHMELEAKGASFEEIRDFERSAPSLGEWRRVPGALIAGNIEEGSLGMGAGVGMIKDIPPAAEVVRRIVQDYDKICQGLLAGSAP
jgi:enoyl-[acyl-carrier protein] reductase II